MVLGSNSPQAKETKVTIRFSYEDLKSGVPVSTLSIRPLNEAPEAAHIRHLAPGEEVFVAPDLISDFPSEIDPDARVILISAPAAVGKSSLARDLSSSSNNPLWDLGRFSVGSGFFTGTITEAYGSSGFDEFRQAFQAGNACLILDAADEALVRAGAQNFEAALENLCKLVGTAPTGRPAAIILGRPDTTADASRILEQFGVRTQVLQVAFFSEPQAQSFVRIKAKGDSAHTVGPELDEFLTSFTVDVLSALNASQWSDAESFVGYAPVLDSLAYFYRREANPLRRLNELKREASSDHVWTLLVDIIETVLERETEKFASSFGASDDTKIEFGRATYTIGTQIALLLADSPEEVSVDFPDVGEDVWLEELEQQVVLQFKDHPFLGHGRMDPNPLLRFANAAFRDYVIASAIFELTPQEIDRVNSYWQSPLVNPSPLLSRFAFSKSAQRTIASSALGIVVDSHSAGFSADARLSIEEYVDIDDFDNHLLDVSLFEGNMLMSEMVAELGDQSLVLSRSLARSSLDLGETTVVIGPGTQDFTIGPDVSLTCGTFDSECFELRIVHAAGSSVKLRASRIVGATRRVNAPAPDSFRLEVPAAAFPWQSHAVEVQDGSESPSTLTLHWAGMTLRKNVKWFARESMTGGSLTYPVSAMEAILNKGRASRDMHDFCVDMGVLTRDGSSFRLELPGFYALTVMENNLEDDAYRSFLTSYLEWISQRS
jgi:hypothetical protein